MANFFSKILNNLFQSDRVADEEFYEELEEAMIQSDVSYPSCMRIIDAVKREADRKGVNLTKDVQKILKDYLLDTMSVDEDYYNFEKEKDNRPSKKRRSCRKKSFCPFFTGTCNFSRTYSLFSP